METKEREEHLEQGPWRGLVEVFVSDRWKVPAPLCPEDGKCMGVSYRCLVHSLGVWGAGCGVNCPCSKVSGC